MTTDATTTTETDTVPYCAAHYRMPDGSTCEECGRAKDEIAAEEQATKTSEIVAGLRALADWMESHPEYAGHEMMCVGRFDLFLKTKDELLTFRQASGATTLEKGMVGEHFWLRRDFGGAVGIDANIPREQACRKVVVGTREVEALTIEAHTEDVIEWRCDPLLASTPEEGVH